MNKETEHSVTVLSEQRVRLCSMNKETELTVTGHTEQRD